MQKVTENYLSKITRYFYFVTEQHCLQLYNSTRYMKYDPNCCILTTLLSQFMQCASGGPKVDP